jgi:hypothetical protein
MLVDVLRMDIGNVLMLLSPFEDCTIEMVFVEGVGEDIYMLILRQEWWHNAIHVQPVVECQDGLFCF